ncbi:MAG: DUF5362 domain-containing protein [bacterium]
MEENQLNPTEQINYKGYLDTLLNVSTGMAGWAKFLGILGIIVGALYCLTIVGIIVAWLPIWLGIVLFQAGSNITNAKMTQNYQHLVVAYEKLRLFFMVWGIVTIISLALMVIAIIIFGAFFSQFINQFQQFNQGF